MTAILITSDFIAADREVTCDGQNNYFTTKIWRMTVGGVKYIVGRAGAIVTRDVVKAKLIRAIDGERDVGLVAIKEADWLIYDASGDWVPITSEQYIYVAGAGGMFLKGAYLGLDEVRDINQRLALSFDCFKLRDSYDNYGCSTVYDVCFRDDGKIRRGDRVHN